MTNDAGLTIPGLIVGTVQYMSPQQLRGLPASPASDIWAFGCVFYEMLTNRPAFTGGTFSDVVAAILSGKPDWRRLPARTPRRVRTLLKACLEHEEGCRPSSAAQMASTLNTHRRVTRVEEPSSLNQGPESTTSLETTPTPGSRGNSVVHEPVSILIADLVNETGDDSFTRSIEAVYKADLEQVSFVTCFGRTQLATNSAVDEHSGCQLAIRHGITFVLTPSIKDADGYVLSARLMRALTGELSFFRFRGGRLPTGGRWLCDAVVGRHSRMPRRLNRGHRTGDRAVGRLDAFS